MPLERDRQGQVVREVAPACFALPLPDQPGQFLPLRVALIRDLRRHVPCQQQEEEETGEDVRKPAWWQTDWKAEPTPATPTSAKLIPIVTTAFLFTFISDVKLREIIPGATNKVEQYNAFEDWVCFAKGGTIYENIYEEQEKHVK